MVLPFGRHSGRLDAWVVSVLLSWPACAVSRTVASFSFAPRETHDVACRVGGRQHVTAHARRWRGAGAHSTRQCSVRAARVGFIVMELADFMSESWKTHTLQPKPNKTRTLDCTPGTFDYACAFGRCTFLWSVGKKRHDHALRSSPQRASLERSSGFRLCPTRSLLSLAVVEDGDHTTGDSVEVDGVYWGGDDDAKRASHAHVGRQGQGGAHGRDGSQAKRASPRRRVQSLARLTGEVAGS